MQTDRGGAFAVLRQLEVGPTSGIGQGDRPDDRRPGAVAQEGRPLRPPVGRNEAEAVDRRRLHRRIQVSGLPLSEFSFEGNRRQLME